MKRISLTLASAIAFLLCVAAPALAQDGSSLGDRPEVSGSGGSAGAGGTAFTGGDVSTGMLLFVALLVAGALALFISRRRATATR